VPERPDLAYVVPILSRELAGRTVLGARVRKPVVLRCAAAELRGPLGEVRRQAHCVRFALGERDLVISPMLAGRFQLDGRATGDLALALSLDDGRELRYRDDVAMGKVYLVDRDAPIPGLERLGVDVLSPEFTLDRFVALARARRDQVKTFLMDKADLDSMGNAYADEVLWAARLHPKRTVRSLTPGELAALHTAIRDVLAEATATIAARKPELHEKLRDFLHVRGRAGEPCDRCGTTLRTAGVHGHDAYFCPRCQQDVGGKGIVDWRKII
jgi:formamidopyrimidine-DNA glycosylase